MSDAGSKPLDLQFAMILFSTEMLDQFVDRWVMAVDSLLKGAMPSFN
jgi:hypothetical protein